MSIRRLKGIVMVLGITGGIATGKSSVAAMFGDLGAVVLSADDLARAAVAPGSDALASLVDRFGQKILTADGCLDRVAMAALVFADPSARDELNRITHPAIAILAEEQLLALRAAGHEMIVYEAPLLFEAAAESRVDRILVVITSPEIQLDRLISRDRINRDEALARIAAQMPLAEKVRRADYLVDNSGPVDETELQVDHIYRELAGVSPE